MFSTRSILAGVCNHITCAVDLPNGKGRRILVIPFGLHWTEVTPDNLIEMDLQGNVTEGVGKPETSALNIHGAVHRASWKHGHCVLHTHMPYATALNLLEAPHNRLLMAHQNSCRFYGGVVYDPEYNGVVEGPEEGVRMAAVLTAADKGRVLFMPNHGVLVSCDTVALAWETIYYLERACQAQVLASQTGKPMRIIPDDVARFTFEQERRAETEYSEAHFAALTRLLLKSSEGADFVSSQEQAERSMSSARL